MNENSASTHRYQPNAGTPLQIIMAPIQGSEIHNSKGGDYTGYCYRCGSTNLWDDATAYGCTDCGMLRVHG